MIKGKGKTEASYRAIPLDSSSSLKVFSEDRKKYYRKFILGETVAEKENHAANMGRIVELNLMEPEEFDNKFYMSSAVSAPTGMMEAFVFALYKHATEATDKEGVLTRSFEDISRDAYEESGYKIKYEAVMSKFIGSEAEIYYEEYRTVKSKNLTVVTSKDVTIADKIVNTLKTNFVTSEIVNKVNSARWEVFNQFQVEGYFINGLEMKSMLDKVIVDHVDQQIQIVDLKCTWSVENFYEDYYLYRRAYIQGYVYREAILSLTKNPDSDWYGYTVLLPKFLVCDSFDYMNPLIFNVSAQSMDDAYLGFSYRGRNYPGVKSIIEDLKWAKKNDVWNISKTSSLDSGIVII